MRSIIMPTNTTSIKKLYGLVILLFVLLGSNMATIWRYPPSIPILATQPNGERLSLSFVYFDKEYKEIGAYKHDSSMATVMKDPETGFWVYAKPGADGWSESTGIIVKDSDSIIIRSNKDTPAPPTPSYWHWENCISNERIEEIKQDKSKRRFENINPKMESNSSINRSTFDLPYSASPHVGNIKNLVIFLELSGYPVNPNSNYINSINAIINMMNRSTNSLKSYWKTVSYDALFIDSIIIKDSVGSAFSWNNPMTVEAYLAMSEDNKKYTLKIFVTSVIYYIINNNLISPSTASELDSDNDGYIDNISIVLRTDNFNLSTYGESGFLDYNFTTSPLLLHGKTIDKYCFFYENELLSPSRGLNVLCHEIGHSLGLRDYYKVEFPLSPVGSWTLMSGGLVTPGPHGLLAYLMAEYFPGWGTTIATINSTQTVELNAVSESKTNHAVRINSPYDTDEFFIVEYRRQIGIDADLPGQGLIVYRVNPNAITIGWDVSQNLVNYSGGNIDGDTIIDNEYNPYEILIYRPDGTELNNYADGEINDAFFSNNVARRYINDYEGNPRALLSNNTKGGLNIKMIGSVGSTISFQVLHDDVLAFPLNSYSLQEVINMVCHGGEIHFYGSQNLNNQIISINGKALSFVSNSPNCIFELGSNAKLIVMDSIKPIIFRDLTFVVRNLVEFTNSSLSLENTKFILYNAGPSTFTQVNSLVNLTFDIDSASELQLNSHSFTINGYHVHLQGVIWKNSLATLNIINSPTRITNQNIIQNNAQAVNFFRSDLILDNTTLEINGLDYEIDGTTVILTGNSILRQSSNSRLSLINGAEIIITSGGLEIINGAELINQDSLIDNQLGSQLLIDGGTIEINSGVLWNNGFFTSRNANNTLRMNGGSFINSPSSLFALDTTELFLESATLDFGGGVFHVSDYSVLTALDSLSVLNIANTTFSFSDTTRGQLSLNHVQTNITTSSLLLDTQALIIVGGSFSLTGGEVLVNQTGNLKLQNNALLTLNTGSLLKIVDNQLVIENTNQPFLFDPQQNLVMKNADFYLINSQIEASTSPLTSYQANITLTNNSSLTIDGGNFEYGNYGLTLHDSSLLLNEGTITFTSGAFLDVQGESTIMGNTATDKLYFAGTSRMLLQAESQIISATSTKWGGIEFINVDSLQVPSKIYGSISGIQELLIDRHQVLLSGVKFIDSGRLLVINQGVLEADSLQYTGNTKPIHVLGGQLFMSNSLVSNNLNSEGIIIENSSFPNKLVNVQISANAGDGLTVKNSSLELIGCQITNNQGYGYYGISNQLGLLNGKSVVANNAGDQIRASLLSFPHFKMNEEVPGKSIVMNTFFPNAKYLSLTGTYYAGQRPSPGTEVNCFDLEVDQSDPTKFFPGLNWFLFEPPSRSFAEEIYAAIITNISQGDNAGALTGMQNLYLNYPDSFAFIKAISVLPYLASRIDYDFSELCALFGWEELTFPEPIFAMQTLALGNMFTEQYSEAIDYYELIMETSHDEQEQIMAELDQAYCYYQLVHAGSRSLPSISRRKPTTFHEYLALYDELHGQISPKEEQEKKEDTVPAIIKFSVMNYPNPFNPSTTIYYSLPHESNVELTIYNIKGQKVKTLVKEIKAGGKHRAVWSGTDDLNRVVGSGVYFYRIEAQEFTAVKKMILLK